MRFQTAFGATVCRDLVGDLLREPTDEAEAQRKARCRHFTLAPSGCVWRRWTGAAPRRAEMTPCRRAERYAGAHDDPSSRIRTTGRGAFVFGRRIEEAS